MRKPEKTDQQDYIAAGLKAVIKALEADDPAGSVMLVSILLKRRENDYIAVVKGLDDAGGKVVAFQSSYSVATVLVALERAVNNGTLRWRVDKPYAPAK